MRYSHLDKLFTIEGATIGIVTLALTLWICRPRKPARAATPGTGREREGEHSVGDRSASRELRFSDPRTPHALRCALEAEHKVRFEPRLHEGRLEFRAASRRSGIPAHFRLVFEAAERDRNHYTLRIELSWDQMPENSHAYFRTTAQSWFDLWLSGFTVTTPPQNQGDPERYRARAEEATREALHPSTIPELQRAILAALRDGACFRTSHKEGGTTIGFAQGGYYRSDFGECPAETRFDNEEEFLAALRRFYDSDLSRSHIGPGAVPEETAWLLIFRQLVRA